jgi:hypothetical protein
MAFHAQLDYFIDSTFDVLKLAANELSQVSLQQISDQLQQFVLAAVQTSLPSVVAITCLAGWHVVPKVLYPSSHYYLGT